VIDNFREDVAMLETLVSEHEGLTASDLEAIERSLDELRRKIALLDARTALLEGRSDARRRQLDVVFGRKFGLRTRAKGAAAFLAPGTAGRRLERQVAASSTGGWDLADR
jgi:hypothetical protein